MMTLIKGAEVYAPGYLGSQDVFLAGGKICAVQPEIDVPSNLPVEVVDGRGSLLLPGFIDCHVHIAGGGGEGGFQTRTPPIQLTDITTGGVTTVIGTLGTDGTTRTMPDLLAKAYALEEEGVTAYIQTGSYHLPLRTLTGSVTDDIVLVEKIIGVGEVAIADHRSSHPTVEELARLISQARLGGMISGKAGTVNIHMGDSPSMMRLLEQVLATTDIPMKHMVPTHMNRNPGLFQQALAYRQRGGYIDFTTSTTPAFLEEGEVAAWRTLKIMRDAGIPLDGVTFSSDGQGSLPLFDEEGEMCGVGVGKVTSLYQAVVDAVKGDGVPLEDALAVITANPANIYGLKGKGRVQAGWDGDIVLVHAETLEIHTVFAKGKAMIRDGNILVKGPYEQ